MPRWRRILVAVLVVFGCVLAPLSITTIWIHRTLLNTNQYVATVGPLASNPDIQSALATRVSNAVSSADVQKQISDALPPKASFIAPFVANGAASLVHGVTLRVVQSNLFQRLWVKLNTRAHEQIVALLRGNTRHIKTSNGQFALNLQPVVQAVAKRLDGLGVHALDQQAGKTRTIVLFKSSSLKSAQSAVRFFDKLVIALPILTVLFFAVALWLSGDRRRTLLRAALGVALAMALLLTVFNLARSIYLDALPASVNQPAAAAVYDQLLGFLRTTLRTVFAVGVVVGIAAWVAGPGRIATETRTRARHLVRSAQGHTAVNPRVAAFVDAYRVALRVTVVGIGLLLLVLLSHPGPVAVIIIAVIVLLALGLIELLGRDTSVQTSPVR